ncbi:polyribonucleotide nucleotidyltransferase [Thermodesulfobacterium sp.]|jgi:polyribonucleotide nucleotidyltransferase|uniref:polyribonucleotide nucleotidyltransferase n=2 Tax=Thermodesulfobacterium TaxID=1740 RepID=UPI00257FFD1D|nr:polyribonucleotide nucleotidyltransferase [Thermodesulfobacterium sp.]MBZ4681457.1 polyribonucleotide nucleotidyltransferase [Thermodesulfobacterium sp.]MDN5380175.1 polyribonucleotide nucleotidyltransferase [Thermodesulfobacterium sp.]
MKRLSVDLGWGDPIVIETGEYAKFADGSVVVKQGDTAVLVTAVMGQSLVEGVDFTPLSVDYREQSSAWGKIPGGFIKREGKPTDREILVSRVIDRSIRPLFPEGFFYDVVVTALTLSADEKYDPDVLAITGASAALMLSQAPFEGPIAGFRVVRVNGEFILNPTYEQRQQADLELIVSCSEDAIVMVEGGGKEVEEEAVLEALYLVLNRAKPLIESQKKLIEDLGKPKVNVVLPSDWVNIIETLNSFAKPRIVEALSIQDKLQRKAALSQIFEEFVSQYENINSQKVLLGYQYKKLISKVMREKLFKEGKRIDGRTPDEIRPIDIKIHPFERPHGSAVFTRGQTQVFASVTLGSREEAQLVESIYEGEVFKRFMLHYNFPPFCTGEARPWGPPRRREIGHGALAERALEPLIPEEEVFPYIIRVVANVFESNGSSSMATVCAGSLALFDAGVPIRKHVAGIAMGLILEEGRSLIITDILGEEDQLGDMDFKVAGTRDGITSIQMDIKIKGLSKEVLAEALSKAKKAREFILDKMYEAISEPRKTLSPYAPKIEIITVPEDKTYLIIGPGGKTVKELKEKTNTSIWVLEGGKVSITGQTQEDVDLAKKLIEALVSEVEIGKIYEGKITRIEPYGLFIEVLPGKIGLLHVSKMANPPKDLKSAYNIGEVIRVKVIEIDDLGRPKFTDQF